LTQNPDGSYTITSKLDPSLVLDVAAASAKDGANIQVYTSNNSPAQHFFLIHMPASSAPSAQTLPNGIYTVTSALPAHRALDIPAASEATGAPLQIYGANGTLAQMFLITYESDGFYSLVAMNSGLALAAVPSPYLSTTPITQQAPSASDTQRWALEQDSSGNIVIVAKTSGLVFDVTWGADAQGSRIQLYAQNNTASQDFIFTPVPDPVLTEGTIVSIAPWKVSTSRLDIASASRADGAFIQTYASNNTLAQKFEVKVSSPGIYTFQALCSGGYLAEDATGKAVQAVATTPDDTMRWELSYAPGGIAFTNVFTGHALTLSGTVLTLVAPTRLAAQSFRITEVPLIATNAYYLFTTRAGLSLDVQSASLADGAALWLYTPNATPAQKFKVVSAGGNYVSLSNAYSGKVLDVKGGSSVAGVAIQQYTSNGTAAQKWQLIPTGDGYFYLKSALGTYLSAASDSNGQRLVTCVGTAGALKVYFTVTTYLPNIGIIQDFRSVFDHGPKPAQYQKYIMLHDTEGLSSPANIISGWASSGNRVAAHFIVDRDGTIYQCVPMDRIAHHAGYGDAGHNALFAVSVDGRDDMLGAQPIGSWAPDYGMNSFSIGIEMVHVTGGAAYTEAQLQAVDRLISYIDAFYGFESTIIDHKAWRSGNSDTSAAFAPYLRNYQTYRRHTP
jgi:hypothetical protein